MNDTIDLVCYNCGKHKTVPIYKDLQFAYELVGLANGSGMFGVIDDNRHRALVFCNKNCCEQALTKSGVFKARAPYLASKKGTHSK